jgi:predicted ArsR family transcriptional regulator
MLKAAHRCILSDFGYCRPMGLELGATQQALLRSLLHNKAGVTVDELGRALGVSRNAVRQHLSALERDGMVTRGPTQPTGGRPEQLYRITPSGQERFPRQYSWFAEMLMKTLETHAGRDGAAEQLDEMGRNVGEGLRAQLPETADPEQRLSQIAGHMAELGYEASANPDAFEIEAQNCVFHQLATKYPQLCRFDLGLLEAASGQTVQHRACMVRGDAKCCFRFLPKRESAAQ